ncbi:hypothetical protein BGW36DRAFT_381233 [Talaromyces proteolyticus]|uniref:Uncharacterized protein n=1 Tax=Talaromyces proteolyticus TaxID=1131652 RepID=A0AAD4KQA3_9EURO|nr:uncharacterized protein BGW36DRAFT_381233 [Talaromyces proteolyticus]KAH8696558.1 hypothetical protein BGW36DRAFT_381233 [Talaromyces proteolyticus]
MHFSIPAVIMALAVGSAVANEQMQLNYYNDGGCSDYSTQVDVTWATKFVSGKYNSPPSCYNYQYGNSVNVANCHESHCWCDFYEGDDCTGYSQRSIYENGGSNCATASNRKSFQCWYT